MKPIKIEAVSTQDAEVLVKWLQSTAHNLADPSVFFYPRARVLKAVIDNEPIAFLPGQITLTLESFAISPNATLLQRARAMRDLTMTFITLADRDGIREVNFFTADDSTAEMAAKYGFEEVHARLFRLKIPQPAIEPSEG